MKVTLLTYEFPPHVYGGAGVHVENLAPALANLADLEVRTLDAGRTPRPRGFKVRRYSGDPDLAPDASKVWEILAWNVRMVSDAIEADIVHTHTWYTNFAGALAKRMYGGRLVATVHSLEPLRLWKREQLGAGYDVSSWMEREGLAACDAIIAVSEEMKRDILRCYDLPASRITVIPNGVDPSVFRPRDGRATLRRFGIRRPFVLFVGRLTEQKGVFDLVEAMRQMPNGVSLVLVSGKPDTPTIEDRLRRVLEGREGIVWIPQMLGRSDLVGLYAEASVFACPSIYEPFGIINLEAMACETPVVATRVGGIKDVVVDGETGLLVPPGDPARLAWSIRTILEDPALASRLGRAGRRRVLRGFTWARVAETTLALYRSLLSRP